jgi:2-C-methyl-D-erythritol 4-phosphate cytidylyltransferase
MQVAAIIPAAGLGKRMGDIKKPYLELAGKPILAHTLMVFQHCSLINTIIVIVVAGDEDKCFKDMIIPYGLDKVHKVVTGGDTRQESVFNGLKSLSSNTEIVIVHDCARPFVKAEMIKSTLEAAIQWGASTVAIPVKDTIKEADDDNLVVRTLDRQKLWSIQTPQAFKYDLIIKAHLYARENNIKVTDDASLIEVLGLHRVKLVMGSEENIKITTPGDLAIARAIMIGL